MASQVCQNFHAECEAALNPLVNLELHTSYTYQSMACHFDRDDVALHHIADFLRKQSRKAWEQAEKFLKYQNKRGGRVVLQDIKKPDQDEWGNSLDVLQKALELGKKVNQFLLQLHKLAVEKGDPHFCAFLESEYLEEEVKTIRCLADHLTNLKHLGLAQSGIGEYLFDKLTLQGSN
ncbi:ferritin heavy chain A-like [Vipera latastei]